MSISYGYDSGHTQYTTFYSNVNFAQIKEARAFIYVYFKTASTMKEY